MVLKKIISEYVVSKRLVALFLWRKSNGSLNSIRMSKGVFHDLIQNYLYNEKLFYTT